MRKLHLIMLLILLVAVVSMTVCATAATATVSVNAERAYRGDTVILHAVLTETVAVRSGYVYLEYDKSVLELVGGSCDLSGTIISDFDIDMEDGVFAFDQKDQTISGSIFSVEFKVKDNAALGTSTVTMFLMLKDGASQNIALDNRPGSVTVECMHSYGETVNDACLKTSATCTGKAVYYKSCSMCGTKSTETFEHGEIAAHAYTESAEQQYLKSTATCTAKAVYYKSCSECGAKGRETFEYGEKLSHSFQEDWVYDGAGHWRECSVCHEKTDEASHIPGAAATETTDQTCTVCGYVLQKALGHIHDFVILKNDNEAHWYECSCGEKEQKQAHQWDDGTIIKDATSKENGEKQFACTVCGSTKMVSIPAVTADDNSNALRNGIIISSVAVAVCGGGFAAYWFVFRKKRM